MVEPEEEESQPWKAAPSRKRSAKIPGTMPKSLTIISADQLYLAKAEGRNRVGIFYIAQRVQ